MQNSTDVVTPSGYDVVSTNNATTSGNNNAFFTLVFDKTNLANTAATTSQIVYGDMTSLGLDDADVDRHGRYDRITSSGGSMGGTPVALSIRGGTAVPLPAAVWLFGSALVGLLGLGRRKSVLPA